MVEIYCITRDGIKMPPVEVPLNKADAYVKQLKVTFSVVYTKSLVRVYV
jgi:hypothetical protein